MKFRTKFLLIALVLGVVGLNLLGAIAMKVLADRPGISLLFLLFGIGSVILLNGLRLVVWMFANDRFPLSTMYPLTSIFYPLMLVVSFFWGEKFSPLRIGGTVFITLGVFWL